MEQHICFNVILPEKCADDVPTVFLLHGLGGDGALKLALAKSETYAACGALSGAVDIYARFLKGDRHECGVAIWGENYLEVLPGSGDDPFELTRRLEQAGKPKPWIFQACARRTSATVKTNLSVSSFNIGTMYMNIRKAPAVTHGMCGITTL